MTNGSFQTLTESALASEVRGKKEKTAAVKQSKHGRRYVHPFIFSSPSLKVFLSLITTLRREVKLAGPRNSTGKIISGNINPFEADQKNKKIKKEKIQM
jgi:hypothetical protein